MRSPINAPPARPAPAPIAAPMPGRPKAEPISPPAAAPPSAPMPAPFSRVVNCPPEHPVAITAVSPRAATQPVFLIFILPPIVLLLGFDGFGIGIKQLWC